MVDDRLVRGALIAPFGAGDPTGAAYYLCKIADAPSTAATRRVERWLRRLAAAADPAGA
jgi:LysR family transcriptional regulator, glycine cleavage system transcriptional activator